jgi:16S rRNA (guanine966-N2)-methyltransferase
MTRVVAGAARGRRLAVPAGSGTRPTSDRAREALFSSLEATVGSLAGARVADLFAGSGAVGLEALSRGAAHCLLVEADPAALRALRRNVETVGLPGAVVTPGRVERVVAVPAPGPPYDVVFLDPPYDLADADVHAVVDALRGNRWLAPGAVVVVERATRGGTWTWPEGVEALRSRRYGEATLWYGRAADPAGPAEPVETAGE